MAPDTRGFAGPFVVPRNLFESKWDILFDKNPKEWIAFKPALGLHVYPCYSCRHMFYSKKSFLDHVNRRAVVLKYQCHGCNNENLTFYNRCSFLIHSRKHYSIDKGSVNLNNLEVSTLPYGLAGFSRHPDIPYIFDVEEELITDGCFMNSQFYTPKIEDRGKEIVSLTPTHLVINRSNQNVENRTLALKQIARNIPKCQFISLQALRELAAQMREASQALTEVKTEPEDCQMEQITFSEEPAAPLTPPEQQLRTEPPQDTTPTQKTAPSRAALPSDRPAPSSSNLDELVMPVITKIETVQEPLSQPNTPNRREAFSPVLSSPPPLTNPLNKCSECNNEYLEMLSHHFLGDNRPMNEGFRCVSCKLICPTLCSFKAHARIHEKVAPYVCPDCGIEFPELTPLLAHMDEVCFHMAKSVRYRCPGRRCGKIFASDATFGPHFKQIHIDTLYMCGSCREVFSGLEDCEEHCLSHDEDSANIVKLFSCSTCSVDDMNWHQLRKHVEFHCNDLSRCIYIFMCKFCKGYFRSVQTMATHLKNCKVHKTGGPPKRVRNTSNFTQSKYISGQCKLCKNKIICLRSRPSVYCNKCLTAPMKAPIPVKKAHIPNSEKCVCILCKVQIDFDERRRHQQECKYAKPQVMVERFDLDSSQLNQSFSSSNSEFEGSHDGSPQKHRRDSSDENRPRKRHKPSKPKKPELENDLTAEEPILFTGTYQCRLCDYKSTEREGFHNHIKVHRHISTAYQCMECGECFVVKPSLVKHLLHFHNISNSERYFEENDCFDHTPAMLKYA